MGSAEERVREMRRQGRAEEDEEDREEGCTKDKGEQESQGSGLLADVRH